MHRAIAYLQQELGRFPTRDEIAEECSMSDADLDRLKRSYNFPVSLDQPCLEEHGQELGDLVATESESLEEHVDQSDLKSRVAEQLQILRI